MKMQTKKEFRKIGNMYVSTMCLDTMPCQHVVQSKLSFFSLFGKPKHVTMNGADIYRELQKQNVSDPLHFDNYKEYVRRIDSPTPEEMEENKRRAERDKENLKTSEERMRMAQEEEFARQQEWKRFSSSSRIARLHAAITP
jgi:hypothetical protein